MKNKTSFAAFFLGTMALLGIPARGQQYQVLHQFHPNPANPSGLIQGTDGNFYGTTGQNGASGGGTVFKMDAAGTVTTLHAFIGSDGVRPLAALIQGSDGDFYGATNFGGASGFGTVFKITPSGTFTSLHSFSGSDGKSPQFGRWIQASDGNFYGTTIVGGAKGAGTVFKITPSGTLTTLHSFAGSEGSYPSAGLIQVSDGNFYGTTALGGARGLGTVFKMDAAGAVTRLYSFSGSDGSNPQAELTEGSDGSFYGTTPFGGTLNNVLNRGSVFKITPAGAFTSLHSFTGNDGANPQAGLIKGSDGNLYGTTYGATNLEGSASSAGTVFKTDSSGNVTTLHSFAGSDGARLSAGMIQARDGNFYGTTNQGGAEDDGTVFKMNSAGNVTTLHSFTGGDGFLPRGGLTQGSDGNFYGTTHVGGASGATGSFFKMDSSGTLTTRHSFTGSDGLYPNYCRLIDGNDGNFYGTTQSGGMAGTGFGTVFKITPAGAVTTLHSFARADGEAPAAGLSKGSDGNFYGLTTFGGTFLDGTVFKITPSGTFTSLHSFAGSDGQFPFGTVIQGSDGNFYGTTAQGGAAGAGTVFKMDSSGAVTTLHSFMGSDGSQPHGGLTPGSGGNLYGMTTIGGAGHDALSGYGTVFMITPSGAFTLILSFTGIDGSIPFGELTRGSDAGFYGTTQQGGATFNAATFASGFGTVFKITPTGTLTTLHSFAGNAASDGASPYGGPIQARDGSFYGTTEGGGLSFVGVAYRIIIAPPPPTITNGPPPNGLIGVAYNLAYTSTGSPTFRVTAGSLPPGLSLSSVGVISGTPTTAGTFSGSVTASNGTAPDATQSFSILIASPTPTITNGPPPDGTLGSAYTFAYTSTGFPTFLVTAGSLPPGLSSSPAGVISGTPTIAGTFSGSVTASNGTVPDATQNFSIIVRSPLAADQPTFGTPVISGIGGTGFEQNLRLDPTNPNRIYTSVPGTASADTSWIWHSEDGGKTFKWVAGATALEGKVTTCHGGGDTELAVDAAGHLYFNDLTLANFSTARSDDRGGSFLCSNTGVPDTAVDRQWYATDGDPTAGGILYLTNDEIGPGNPVCPNSQANNALVIYRSPVLGLGATAGIEFGPANKITALDCNEAIMGNIEVSPVATTLGQPTGTGTFATLPTPVKHVYVIHDDANLHQIRIGRCFPVGFGPPVTNVSDPSGINCTDILVKELGVTGVRTGGDFATMAIDRAGNLYAVWEQAPITTGSSITGDVVLMYAYSRDQGNTWSRSMQIDTSGAPAGLLHTNVFAWIGAGDDGRIDIAWYGTPGAAASGAHGPDDCNGCFWSLWMVQSLNAHDPVPTFTSPILAGEHFNHRGTMQTIIGGQQMLADRSMGDFLQLRIGPLGEAQIAYANSNNIIGSATAHAMYIRQNGGPGLYAATSPVNIPGLNPINSVTDPTGDGKYEVGGTSSANMTNLDIIASRITKVTTAPCTIAGPCYEVVMKLNNLSLAPNTSQDPDVDLVWLTQWFVPSTTDGAGGKNFHVYAESANGGALQCFTGENSAILVGGGATLGYPGTITLPAANCRSTLGPGGTVTIDVPLSMVSVGGRLDDLLHSVTASTMTLQQPANAAPSFGGVGGVLFNLIDVAQPYAQTNIVAPPAPTITNGPPLDGTVGVAYNFAYTSTGSPTFSVTAGSLPPGLTLSAAGVISGTPTAAGTFSGTVTASNGTAPNATQNFSIIIAPPPPTITNGPPPDGTVGVAYNFAYTATSSPTFSVTAGSLPPGLSLSSAGVLSGTPATAGTFPGTVTASNGTAPNATQDFSIMITSTPPPLSIGSIAPSAVCQGGPAFTLTVDGSGFVSGSVVQLDNSPRSTTFVSSTRLTATITASDIAAAASRTIKVVNPGNNASNTATLTVTADTTAPVVTAPAAFTTTQTMCPAPGRGGATGSTSPGLASYIAGGSATDNCTQNPSPLAPQAGGNDVTNSTVFPAGTTTLTFRFRDNAGNTGTATSTVTVRLLADLNADNAVDAQDLVIMANYLVGNVSPGTPPFTAPIHTADLNGDGKVDAVDLVIQANYLAANITCLPLK